MNAELVRRAEIPAIDSVVVDGHEYSLGSHQDFSRHPKLASFIPKDAKFSMSWVHLSPGQTLEVHEHPTSSMIIACRGHARILGEIEREMDEGDILMVPPGSQHGFQGLNDGFWGLSVQFEDVGLYGDLRVPKVGFISGE